MVQGLRRPGTVVDRTRDPSCLSLWSELEINRRDSRACQWDTKALAFGAVVVQRQPYFLFSQRQHDGEIRIR